MNSAIKLLTLLAIGTYIALPTRNASSVVAQEDSGAATITFDGGWRQPPFLPTGDNNQDAMRLWAWKQFLALNWPAKAGVRGVPDTSKTLADMKDRNQQSVPRVWETWMPKESLFLPKGKRPAAWSDPIANEEKNLVQNHKVHGSLRDITEIDEAVGGDLLDQNWNFLRFHVLINNTMYSAVRGNNWYNAFEQLSSPLPIELPGGSIELKAAWKILVESPNPQKDPALGNDSNYDGPRFEDDPSRYLTARATVYQDWDSATQKGIGQPLNVTVGLVGIHIVTKDPNRPQRLWATFEQVDNVEVLPEYRQVTYKDKPLQPSLFNPRAPKFDPQDPKTHNYRPNLRIKYQTDRNNPVPVQVTREIPIPESMNTINGEIRGLLKKAFPQAPWQYYQLIDIQFPGDPSIRRDGDPIPQLLGNTAIETFNQSESSCLGCHSFARPVNKFELSDFSWIMGQANWPDRSIPPKTNGRQLFAYMTQDVPYVHTTPLTTAPKGGPFYLTWNSFPDSKWNTYSGFMAGENPHGASTRIYINDVAHEFARRYEDNPDLKPEPFPVGSIILKENHRSWLPGNLVEFTAMLKREKGYAPESGDWFWLKASPGGKIWREGKTDGCINCHRQPTDQPERGNFMLSWNYGLEPYRHNYATHEPAYPRPLLAKPPSE